MRPEITVKVIADSISPVGKRITTMQLTYPRFIHAEFLTHRAFSRNSSSSRAIPVAKVLEQVRANPAMPLHWGKNQPGMQARQELDEVEQAHMKELWGLAAEFAAKLARRMMEAGLHKQVANRVLEPFQVMHTLVTATEWDNFFALRCHPDAQPEIQALACAMRNAIEASTPRSVGYNQWHLPYVRAEERLSTTDALRASAARCARVSYLKHDGQPPSLQDDLALFERLTASDPMHASPLEHQATPSMLSFRASGNFRGWHQFRRTLEEIEHA